MSRGPHDHCRHLPNHSLGTDPATKNPANTLDLKGEKCAGAFWFDTRGGRLQKFEDTVEKAGGSDSNGVQIVYEMKCKSVVTVSDKPPKDA